MFIFSSYDSFFCNDSGVFDCIVGAKYGNYMMYTYFFIKIIYLMNAVGQLFLLDSFIGDGYLSYGIDIMTRTFNGEKSFESTKFPRVTLCSFYIREVSDNIHRHTVQCVLSINIFNEKIYAFLWFWLVFIALFSSISVSKWAWDVAFRTRVNFIKHYLKLSPDYEYNKMSDKKCIQAFANKHLKQDGVFILRLIERNVNEIIVCEIIYELYMIYKEKYYKPKKDERFIDEELHLQ